MWSKWYWKKYAWKNFDGRKIENMMISDKESEFQRGLRCRKRTKHGPALDKAEKTLHIRLTNQELKNLKQVAKHKGLTMSYFVLSKIKNDVPELTKLTRKICLKCICLYSVENEQVIRNHDMKCKVHNYYDFKKK
jgi:hypothetical protein